MVEHLNRNQEVAGSTPASSTINIFRVVFIIKSRKKKAIGISAGAFVLAMLAYLYKHQYKPNYQILDKCEGPYASYSCGFVYIGDKEYLNSLEGLSLNDILVLDERDQKDPNIEIYNSYIINDKDIRNEILEIICCYENEYPSEWDRSIESMRLEWFCHNVSWYLNYKTDRTSEVDLNNKDEERYDQKVLSRILKL